MSQIRTEKSRIRILNPAPIQKGDYILYWMQQSQRAEYNHALEYAIEIANHYKLPVIVAFVIMEDYPEANQRHYIFMLQGLMETRQRLKERGIRMVVELGSADKTVPDFSKKAAAVVFDRGYMRHQRLWRKQVAQKISCRCIEVESDVVVPVAQASLKKEYAAYTIRPKIKRKLDSFLFPIRHLAVITSFVGNDTQGIDLEAYLKKQIYFAETNKEIHDVRRFFTGGTSEAKKRFNVFLKHQMADYDKNSNQPHTDNVSCMSPYLHFGQISPLYLALKIHREEGVEKEVREKFLEQLIVRRELAVNFVYYTPNYDTYNCLPQWAKTTLADHARDKRDPIYTKNQLEQAKTHDPYWDAAMNEMIYTGYMHNYMRMYWAKKILEWSISPENAFETTLYLNNKYFLDGRDPNSYAGVAWSYGLHDRAWKEREIFGKVRYMAASGLERKCDIRAYVSKIEGRMEEAKKTLTKSNSINPP